MKSPHRYTVEYAVMALKPRYVIAIGVVKRTGGRRLFVYIDVYIGAYMVYVCIDHISVGNSDVSSQ